MSLSLFYAGPPEVTAKVSITPMAPLRSALEQAISKMGQVRPPLDANTCLLMLHEGGGRGGGKPVSKALDLACPLRLAGISSTARIEVVRSSSTLSEPASATARPSMQPRVSEAARPSTTLAETPSPMETDAPSSAPETETDLGIQAKWKSLGLDREIAVYSKDQLDLMMALPYGRQSQDETDDFFELTPEDLAIMRQAQEAKRKEEAVLKTRALREADEIKKASSYGSVPLRIHFPSPVLGASGTMIVQAAFSPLEQVSAVKQLVSKLLHPSVGSSFQLFTTPPRVILKDMEATLFKAQLVPAANIHFASGDKDCQMSSYLKDEIMSLILPELNFNLVLPGQDRSRSSKVIEMPPPAQGAIEAGISSTAAEEQSKVEGGGPGRYLGGAKLPKWMKL
jgi:hypothetical protein